MFSKIVQSHKVPSLETLLQTLNRLRNNMEDGCKDLQHSSKCSCFPKVIPENATNWLPYKREMHLITFLEARSSRPRYLFLLRPLSLGCELALQCLYMVSAYYFFFVFGFLVSSSKMVRSHTQLFRTHSTCSFYLFKICIFKDSHILNFSI